MIDWVSLFVNAFGEHPPENRFSVIDDELERLRKKQEDDGFTDEDLEDDIDYYETMREEIYASQNR